MKIISQNESTLTIETLMDEVSTIEQGIGIINGTYHVEDFEHKIGTTNEKIEEIRKYFRHLLDSNLEYHKLRMLPVGQSDTNSFVVTLTLSKEALPWVKNALQLALDIAGEEEFHTLTGHSFKEAQGTIASLKALAVFNNINRKGTEKVSGTL